MAKILVILYDCVRSHLAFQQKGICMTIPVKPKRANSRPAASPADFHRVAGRLKQVSDLTRLRVLLLLGDNERSVGALCLEISCSMTALSRHLALLRLAGLIVARRNGQQNIYALTDAGWILRKVVQGVGG
jgi:DNA-binding transcriptional ArsR family regulator